MMISVLLGIWDTCKLRRAIKIETLMVDGFGVCLACHMVDNCYIISTSKITAVLSFFFESTWQLMLLEFSSKGYVYECLLLGNKTDLPH